MGGGNISPSTVQHGPMCLRQGAERLDRFGEEGDENERDGVREASVAEAPHEEEAEAETMDEDDREEEGSEGEDENMDDEDWGEESKSHSSSGSTQEIPHSIHCYSYRFHCPPPPREW